MEQIILDLPTKSPYLNLGASPLWGVLQMGPSPIRHSFGRMEARTESRLLPLIIPLSLSSIAPQDARRKGFEACILVYLSSLIVITLAQWKIGQLPWAQG